MESSTPPRDTAWAMSEENVEILGRLFDAWNSGDFDAMSAPFDPEVEFNPGLLPPDEETRYFGREGVL